ncbi:hypothetical protein EVB41_066 [Rhizobium phage RHph_TM3_14A]|nr:hypothetical protein EVB29_066 [Rhizobium phage RHph_TM27A]QIG66986.1 hypothetical protein EVB30_066 [Rhizobium phage RHph_TM27B]QIG67075.1 hypothetical protein EVB31_065 [Rhizobium phage RHph_TM29]QIG67531.1 hypothetical protein EVB41_066 [Rhizobium phage RHph_TM3_14A]
MTDINPHAFEPLPGTKPVPVHEHTDGCRWPIGEHPTMYCNARVMGKTARYCTAHSRMSYTPLKVTSHGNLR